MQRRLNPGELACSCTARACPVRARAQSFHAVCAVLGRDVPSLVDAYSYDPSLVGNPAAQEKLRAIRTEALDGVGNA